MRLITTFFCVCFIVGCASGAPKNITVGGRKLTDREIQCLERVEVLIYDPSPRLPSPRVVEIYDETRRMFKPHKEIALLTCEGAAREEIDMTKGIMEKARLLGADAIIILNPITGSDFQMGHGGSRAVFRAKAVIVNEP